MCQNTDIHVCQAQTSCSGIFCYDRVSCRGLRVKRGRQLDNGGSCACHGGEGLNQGREAMGPQLHWDDLFIRENP